jgi:hypothetical protein
VTDVNVLKPTARHACDSKLNKTNKFKKKQTKNETKYVFGCEGEEGMVYSCSIKTALEKSRINLI